MKNTVINPSISKLSTQLLSNNWFKFGEIALVFMAGLSFIYLLNLVIKDDPILTQVVIWFANILMLTIVWIGLKLRGESLRDFGLTFKPISWRGGMRIFLLSLVVFVLAISGFIIGSIIMANITGIPQEANMSGYAYLKDNLGMFISTLVGVYVVASFGEEVIYRAFLINRFLELGVDSKKSRIISIILSSVIFGLVHYQWGLMGMVQTGFMGLALGICYLKFGKKLWILILAHAYMDTILMIQMYLASN